MQENIAKKYKNLLLFDVSSRFSKTLKERKILQEEVASWFKVSRQSISNIVNGKSGLTTEHIIILKEKIPDLNFYWLLFGEGEMNIEIDSHNVNEPIPPYNITCTNPECNQRIKELKEYNTSLKRNVELLEEKLKEVTEGVSPPEKKVEGGVEEPRKTG